jgi:hypothetical protein
MFREINVLTDSDKEIKVLKVVTACGIFSSPMLRKPDERKSIDHFVSYVVAFTLDRTIIYGRENNSFVPQQFAECCR